MTLLRWSVRLHKWIGLVVGVQVLLWVLGGLVMTAIPIERVRGEHRAAERPAVDLRRSAVLPLELAAAGAPGPVAEAAVRQTPRGAVWALKLADGSALNLDARTGRPLPPLGEAEARRIARAAYAGEAEIVSAQLLPEAPQETRREGPLWRVDFDDAEGTSIYLAPDTGEVASRRSDLWRFYDFWWRVHILDLENGEDFNHPLLVTLAGASVIVVLTGFVLLWLRLGADLRAWARRRRG